MNILFILNDAPSATERSLNGLRLACSMSVRPTSYVRVFLIGAAVACARKHHPQRSDDAQALITSVIHHGGDVRVCTTCAEDSGEGIGELLDGATLSSLNELSRWIPEADRLLVF